MSLPLLPKFSHQDLSRTRVWMIMVIDSQDSYQILFDQLTFKSRLEAQARIDLLEADQQGRKFKNKYAAIPMAAEYFYLDRLAGEPVPDNKVIVNDGTVH